MTHYFKSACCSRCELTCPMPMVNLKGRPLRTLLSNTVPSLSVPV